MSSWWLSFADGDRPVGTQFLGACIVDASDFLIAVAKTHALGINPGGEVQGYEIPEGAPDLSRWKNRLMSRAECDEMDREILGTA